MRRCEVMRVSLYSLAATTGTTSPPPPPLLLRGDYDHHGHFQQLQRYKCKFQGMHRKSITTSVTTHPADTSQQSPSTSAVAPSKL
jgi:hypothetical protein